MPNRLKFSLKHLLVCIIIACIAMYIVFFVWYHVPLAKAGGVTYLFLMMLAIDVIIGPILGFIVYKEGKKSLKFDLSVIILLQFSAFIYGFYSIAQGRPVYIAYVVDRFELVRNNDIIDQNIAQAKAQYQHPSWFKPQYVATQFAKDTKTRNDDMFAEALGGISIAQNPARYISLDEARQQIQNRVQNLSALNSFNDTHEVKKVLSKYPEADSWVPLKANAIDMVVLMNKQDAKVIKIVDLRPWK